MSRSSKRISKSIVRICKLVDSMPDETLIAFARKTGKSGGAVASNMTVADAMKAIVEHLLPLTELNLLVMQGVSATQGN